LLAQAILEQLCLLATLHEPIESLTIAVEELEHEEVDLAGFDALLSTWIAQDTAPGQYRSARSCAGGVAGQPSAPDVPATLSAKLQGSSREALHALLWTVYGAWGNNGIEEPVLMHGKLTWPLPLQGRATDLFLSIESLMRCVGWESAEIALLGETLAGLTGGDSRALVLWPDLQRAFRQAISRNIWDDTLERTYACLSERNTLRLKVEEHSIGGLLVGAWRVFCHPLGDEPFSYGIEITHYEDDGKRFRGRSAVPGQFEISNGVVVYENAHERQHATLHYEEVWTKTGVSEKVTARLKSNGKFICDAKPGYVQKARREDSLSSRDRKTPGGQKYFLGAGSSPTTASSTPPPPQPAAEEEEQQQEAANPYLHDPETEPASPLTQKSREPVRSRSRSPSQDDAAVSIQAAYRGKRSRDGKLPGKGLGGDEDSLSQVQTYDLDDDGDAEEERLEQSEEQGGRRTAASIATSRKTTVRPLNVREQDGRIKLDISNLQLDLSQGSPTASPTQSPRSRSVSVASAERLVATQHETRDVDEER